MTNLKDRLDIIRTELEAGYGRNRASNIDEAVQALKAIEFQHSHYQANMEESERRYQALYETTSDAVLLIRDGLIVDCNSAALTVFDCDRKHIVGQSPVAISPPQQPSGQTSSLQAEQLFGQRISDLPQKFEWTHQRSDGKPFATEVNLTRVELANGPHALVLIRDVDASRRAEEILRANTEKFRSLSENAPDIVFTADNTGRLTHVNPAWKRILGHEASEVLGHLFIDFVMDDFCESLISQLKIIRKGHRPFNHIIGKMIHRNGSIRTVDVSAAPDFGSNGETRGIVGVCHDVTQRLNLEEHNRLQTAYLEELFNSSPEAIASMDHEGLVVKANDEFTVLFGYTEDEAIGRNLDELIVPNGGQERANQLKKVTMGGKKVRTEGECQRQDGSLVQVSILGAPVIVDGVQVGVYAIFRDITERKKAEKALKDSESRHRIVLESAPDPIVVYDSAGMVSYLNPAFTRIFGWTLNELQGGILDFVPEGHDPEIWNMIDLTDNKQYFSGMETQRLTKDGQTIQVSISGAVYLDAQGESLGSVVTLQDIGLRKMSERQLKYLVYHDTLTGLPNRKSFYQRLEEILAQTKRREAKSLWALLFLDLDRFKDINDTLGHDVGDELLKNVAERLKSNLRAGDSVFRLGGDEFTIILGSLSNETDAAKVSEKLLCALAEPMDANGYKLFVSASIGISIYPADGRQVEALVKNADTAMYEAKKDGSRYRFFTKEMNSKALKRIQMEIYLRSALENDEFVIYYQPLVDKDGRIAGVEALIRWEHPEIGLIQPSEFISVAEETGLIIPIGAWVLRQACFKTSKWQRHGHGDLYVAVNLSPRQFKHRKLEQTIIEALEDSGLPPTSLKLEVTESSVMENPNEAVATMKRLHKLGVRFSIDDFGTGYSSLSYLKRFPVETLKIDRSFVADLIDSTDDEEIIKTIIAMARNMSMMPLAEGVETEDQRKFLSEQGCTMMQGFLFSKPVPSDEISNLLEHSGQYNKH